MDFAIAKVSTKGQIVIPSALRGDIHTGDRFLMIKDTGRIILKNLEGLALDVKEDIAFAEEVETAWLEHDAGGFESKAKEDFLKELEAC